MNNIKTSPYDVMAVFALPIYKTNIEREFTKQEQDEFDAIVSGQSRGPNIKGTKNVSIDKYLLNRKSFLSIHSFIQHHLKEFATTVIGIDLRKTNWSPHITMSWLSAYETNHFESYHAHPNSIISGVFYINCLKNLAHGKPDGIIFASTSHNMLQNLAVRGEEVGEDTKFSDKPYHVSVVKGDLIIFPSTAHHCVNLNETTDQTRISLAFNVI